MKQQTVCILFGGMSPEHEVSLRSAECILNNIDREKYQILHTFCHAQKWAYSLSVCPIGCTPTYLLGSTLSGRHFHK